MRCDLIFMSDILYLTKGLALKAVNEMFCKKEEEVKTHKWDAVFIPGIDTWRTFEKVRNDSNERYIGIITETMVCEE